jgi:hypothetical protein
VIAIDPPAPLVDAPELTVTAPDDAPVDVVEAPEVIVTAPVPKSVSPELTVTAPDTAVLAVPVPNFAKPLI